VGRVDLTRIRLRYIHEFRDRHGKVRRYVRLPGRKRVALKGVPGTEEFMAAYQAALADAPRIQTGAARAVAGTVNAAIAAYYGHSAFLGLAPQTQKMRRTILERFRAEHGEKRLALMQRQHVAKIVASKKPFAARNWLKALRGLLRFAVIAGLCDDDPTAGIDPPKARAGTIHTWTEAEISTFEARHEIGTQARLAMTLLLFTAARRGDVVGLGPQHIRNGVLIYRQRKTGRLLEIPLHLNLLEILAASPKGHLTFLTTASGAPFSAAGFGNLFRQWCNDAGLSHCSAHGLRKAQARRLAEAGCSAHQIAAITGHKTLAEVQRYADAASQSRLARAAMATVSEAFPSKQGGDKTAE
jgi:integrase